MKRKIVILAIVLFLLAIMSTPVLAGGDKVRGDNGAGSVIQHQVVPPWWSVP